MKTPVKYQVNKKDSLVNEPIAVYTHQVGMDFLYQDATDDKRVIKLFDTSNKGLNYTFFEKLSDSVPFSPKEWADFLHLSERSLNRYKKDHKTFDTTQSEKLLEIALLFEMGTRVFGSKIYFMTWLETQNIALNNKMPKEYLTNSFGISLLKDELTRIEYGILA